MSYAKLFSSITESSLWSEDKDVRLLFVSMLARADAMGFIEAALPGLARLSNLSVQETEAAIMKLESPDRHSKDLEVNPDNEGRRVIKVPGGWMIINYESYRERRNEEDRREYMRDYMKRYRAGHVNNGKHFVNSVSRGKPPLAQAEAEAEAELLPPIVPRTSSASPPRGVVEGNSTKLPTTEQSRRVAAIMHRKPTTPWQDNEVRAYKKIGLIPEDDLAALERYYATQWPPCRDRNILRHDLLTLLNNFSGEIGRAHTNEQDRPAKRNTHNI